VRPIAADDAAIQLAYAQKIIIVPGYGLAAAQAQHQLAELASELEKHGIEVSYAIHPVAGRMPGHMNVLLAEANVPYPHAQGDGGDQPGIPPADVALVVGANDVTNPAARRPGTAISGMPILDVDQAKSIIVIKRSMAPGYAGIDNELYVDPKTSMYFADAKKALTELTAAGQDPGRLTAGHRTTRRTWPAPRHRLPGAPRTPRRRHRRAVRTRCRDRRS
jgi:NAD(P) transhydrogenase subunit beta